MCAKKKKKNCIWILATCNCKQGQYVGNIIDDSVITCDEIIEETKTLPTNFKDKMETRKTNNFYILLAFY